MKKSVFLVVLFMLAQMANAAPDLVIDGTQFKYKGKKIFFSGMNLAWIDFNSDVGKDPLDENKWRKAVQDIRAAGGNSIRWWLFNNMSVSPVIDPSTHKVTGLPANTIKNMKKALDIAEEYGVMVSMCLFSHNLMESDQWGVYSGDKLDIAANKLLFSDNSAAQAFITNALNPVLEAIGNHKALMTWELFNEPEGMITGHGWTKEKISIESIVSFSEKLATAIHSKAPGTLVSTGIHCASDLQYWNKSWLDFLQLHFYPEHQETSQNPFDHPFSFWSLSKPLIIGEFSAAGWNKEKYPAYKVSTKTPQQLYKYAYDNGYAGALSWDYTGFNDDVAKKEVTHNYAAAKPGMEALAAQYEEFIKIKDYTPETTSGNGVMQVTFSNVKSEATLEYPNPTTNLTGKATITFKVRTVNSPAISFRLVVKSGNNWDWKDTQKMCNIPANGEWVTCTYDLSGSDYSSVELGNVRSFLLQTFTDGYSGVVQFDDFKAGTSVITDFNTQYDVFSVAASMDGGEAITNIKTVYLGGTTPSSSSNGNSSSSSSDEDTSPILSHSPLANSHSQTYYSLKGEPLGNAKPQKAGVYIVKQGPSIKKIVVR